MSNVDGVVAGKQGGTFSDKFKTFLLACLTILIALGQYTEAVGLLGDAMAHIKAQYTHEQEYELLERIHVGNTESYVQTLVGSPQVSRYIDEKTTANYYHQSKFLLTVFVQQQRVAAFTYLPLIKDFMPLVAAAADQSFTLGDFNFADLPALPKQYVLDHSKVTSYYLESLESGRQALLNNTYLGNLAYGSHAGHDDIAKLYNAEVLETDEVIERVQRKLRMNVTPNFYGVGHLSLAEVEKGLLSAGEFQNYFGASD